MPKSTRPRPIITATPAAVPNLRPRRTTARPISPDYAPSDTDSQGKLEIKREKNRVKQRNLRIRRANHMAALERANLTLHNECASLNRSLHSIQHRQAALDNWIHDLESTLLSHGLSDQVHSLRRIWGGGEQHAFSVLVEAAAHVRPKDLDVHPYLSTGCAARPTSASSSMKISSLIDPLSPAVTPVTLPPIASPVLVRFTQKGHLATRRAAPASHGR
ncbi:hypothetical protein BD324DRAFT_609143 [Kockovaella imperatae]|uniref:BZIP domain-containing protein n=1 Tax=Kockovaella imperatae TaxID=4999 RepID=A0A1Y1UD02_9TREE|nr:hypothetical protein BD324DRAFT_609143 [Kockovaella imperatae]ORX35869.1 hypothetical protein BD324DRAFT_609143 [Kockovaella imperatae]